MGYLKCEKCWGYYKLREGESSEDFEMCQCGGDLEYFENHDELSSNKSTEIQINEDQSGAVDLKYGNMIFCRNYGISNPLKANFCTKKSKSLDETINMPLKCSKCGNINPIDANFCLNCGEEFKKLENYNNSKNQSQMAKVLDKDESLPAIDGKFAKFKGKGTIQDVQITPNSISTLNNGNKLVYHKTEINDLIFDHSKRQLNFDLGKRTVAIQFLNDDLEIVEKALKDFEYNFL